MAIASLSLPKRLFLIGILAVLGYFAGAMLNPVVSFADESHCDNNVCERLNPGHPDHFCLPGKVEMEQNCTAYKTSNPEDGPHYHCKIDYDC